ncbi:MAG: hypothetical protein ACI30I_04185 [Parabacteroides sp.]
MEKMEKRLIISIRAGRDYKTVDFPIPEEMVEPLYESLMVEDAITGSPCRVEGTKKIKVSVSVYDFERTF